jgi:hypothetical protein
VKEKMKSTLIPVLLGRDPFDKASKTDDAGCGSPVIQGSIVESRQSSTASLGISFTVAGEAPKIDQEPPPKPS